MAPRNVTTIATDKTGLNAASQTCEGEANHLAVPLEKCSAIPVRWKKPSFRS